MAGRGTRERLLDAGVELLDALPVRQVLRSLTARAVARQAGLTTGAFYNYWPSQEDYTADLLNWILDPERTLEQYEMDPADAEALMSGAIPADELVRIVADQCSVAATNGSILVEFVFASKAAEHSVAQQVLAMQAGFDDAYAVAVQALLDHRKRVPRPPWTVRQISELCNALVDGMAVRRRLSGDVDIDHRFGMAVLAFLEALSVKADQAHEGERGLLDRFDA